MIVDCHTHIWESPQQLGKAAGAGLAAGRPTSARITRLEASTQSHLAAAAPVDKTIVLGFKSYYLGAEIPNDFVARYVRQNLDKLIGFAGIDPSRAKEAVEEAHRARDVLGLKGVAVAPCAQDFHPTNTHAMMVYSEVAALGMPILFHHGLRFSRESKLEYARPILLDEVARELPGLRLIVGHLGYPWVEETLLLLGKHEHVYADISSLLEQPFQAYLALQSAYQHGVMDKLLFGSDFPYASATSCIEALYGINQFCQGTNLPSIPREQLRGIVERNALSHLGIASTPPPRRPAPAPLVEDEL